MPQGKSSVEREQKIVGILKNIANEAHSVFLLGDIFDFWFEYTEVVPKGYFKLLNAISELVESGTQVFLFPGNHDLWLNNYISDYCGVKILKEPTEFYFGKSKFHVHHGDGLGPGDRKYKWMKKVFVHPISIFLFRWLHPDIGVKFARYLSSKSRLSQGDKNDKYLGDDKEFLTQYCQENLKNKSNFYLNDNNKSELILLNNNNNIVNYYIFGHRHLQLDISLSEHSRYINLGHWLSGGQYGMYDGQEFKIISAGK